MVAVEEFSHCPAGTGTLDTGGVDFSLSMGAARFGDAVGGLVLREHAPVNLGDPALLKFVGNTNLAEVITGANRQVKSPQMLANITIISNSPSGGMPLAYRIDCYSPSNIGSKDTNGFYQPLNDPFVSWTISNQGTNTTSCTNLLVTETRGAKTYQNLYTYSVSGGTGVWTLSAGNSA